MSASVERIPFNRPHFSQRARGYINESMGSGKTSGDGPFTARCHDLLREQLGVGKVLLTTSCTHALEMAALLLEIEPGDEVIVPSFTFVSTVNAFVLRGAVPVFCDVRPDTLNMDERLIQGLITDRTRAIVPVHYAGVGCEMESIGATAAAHGIAIVEDNAHGLYGTYDGAPLGTFGAMSTQSFHETKNISCGEGGALLLNDTALFERAEIVREKGTNRSRFFRGQVDKYTWVDLGSSYLLSDLLAALLLAQLEERRVIQAARARVWERYERELTAWAREQGVTLPHVPERCGQAYHLFYLLMPSFEDRQRFISHMKGRGVLVVFHYLPLHLSEFGSRYGAGPGHCPVTEDASDRLVRLPLFVDMTEAEQARVLEAALAFRSQ